MSSLSRRFGGSVARIAIAIGVVVASGTAAAADRIDMVVFGAPSLGAFLTPIIKARKIDEKHGIDFNFVERTPDAYIAEFNSGQYQVGGSAALLSIGVANNKGVKVSYLFNLFDYFGAVVTDHADIKTVKDLEGKQLVAASATTNYAMFKWLAQEQGVNLAKVDVQNTATPGLIGYALAGRADAVQLWEPAYSVLIAKKPSLRTLELDTQKSWKKFSGTDAIPYLGVAAHDDWIRKNPKLIDAMYATFKEAADWLRTNPDAGAKLVAASIKGSDEADVRKLIVDNSRLQLDVKTAGDMKKGIQAVYVAGKQSGYLTRDVSDDTIYTGIHP
jgi:NitT/TauT family transport system substrate-binding protein